jgi:hypothetical protein
MPSFMAAEYVLRIFPSAPDTEPYDLPCDSREHAYLLGEKLRAGHWQVMRFWRTEPKPDSPMLHTRLVVEKVRLPVDMQAATEDTMGYED